MYFRPVDVAKKSQIKMRIQVRPIFPNPPIPHKPVRIADVGKPPDSQRNGASEKRRGDLEEVFHFRDAAFVDDEDDDMVAFFDDAVAA